MRHQVPSGGGRGAIDHRDEEIRPQPENDADNPRARGRRNGAVDAEVRGAGGGRAGRSGSRQGRWVPGPRPRRTDRGRTGGWSPCPHARGWQSCSCPGARRGSCPRDLGNALGRDARHGGRELQGRRPTRGPDPGVDRGSAVLVTFVFYTVSGDTGIRNAKIEMSPQTGGRASWKKNA